MRCGRPRVGRRAVVCAAAIVTAAGSLASGATAAVPAPVRPQFAVADLGLSDARAQQESTGQVTVRWTVTGTDPRLTGFAVRRVQAGVSTVVATVGAGTRQATDPLTGLAAGGHLVSYEVAALGDTGELLSTVVFPPMVFRGVPGGPSAVDMTTAGAEVSLAWRAPSVNARLLTGYRVQRRVDPATAFVTVAGSTRQTKVRDVVPDLGSGVHQVEYLITSLAGSLTGGASDVSASAFVNVPSWPERVDARMSFDGAAGVVEWSPPLQNPRLVNGYRVCRSVDGGGQNVLATVGADVYRYIDQGLSNIPTGMFASYTVTALGPHADGGDGPATVDVAHLPVPFVGTVRAVSRDRGVLVSWPVPAEQRAVANAYRVRYRLAGSEPWQDVPAKAVDSVARLTTIAGSNGDTYEVQVSSVDPATGALSSWSAPVRAVVGTGPAKTRPAASTLAASPPLVPVATQSAMAVMDQGAGKGLAAPLLLAASAVVAISVALFAAIARRARQRPDDLIP